MVDSNGKIQNRISRESDYVRYYTDAHKVGKVSRNVLTAREISQGGSIWIPLLRLSLRWLRNVDYDDKAKPY